MSADQPLTFAERRVAIETYRSLSWSDDWQGAPVNAAEQAELSKPYVGPFVTAYLNALSHAEREALRAAGEPVELTTWQLIKNESRLSWQWICEEFREERPVFLLAVLSLACLFGIGCTLVAVKWGLVA